MFASVALACLVTITGCGEEPPERADTVAGAPEETTESVSETPSQAPAGDDAGEVLTKEQAQAALLSAQDLPSGWSVGASEESADESRTQPARCAKIFDALDDDEPVAKASADYSAGGFGPFVSHSVSSHDEETADKLAPIIEALNKCPEFTSIEPDGSRIELSTAPLSFPNFGDRTLSLRMTGTSDDVDVVFDVIYVAKGNNGIAMIGGGLTPIKAKQLESLVGKAMKKLEQAAADAA